MALMVCLFLLSEKPSLEGSCKTERACIQKHERARRERHFSSIELVYLELSAGDA
jgi:hypothetical protein